MLWLYAVLIAYASTLLIVHHVLLFELLSLNDLAQPLDDKTALTDAQTGQACQRYERATLDRALLWVRRKSIPELDFDGAQVLGLVTSF